MKASAKFMVGFMLIGSCIDRFRVRAAVREMIAFLISRSALKQTGLKILNIFNPGADTIRKSKPVFLIIDGL